MFQYILFSGLSTDSRLIGATFHQYSDLTSFLRLVTYARTNTLRIFNIVNAETAKNPSIKTV